MIVKFAFSSLCCIIAATIPSISVSAHELEDGFVERAVEVVIRDNIGTINYYFGINENTLAIALDEWNIDQLSEPIGDVNGAHFDDLLLRRLADQLIVEIDGVPTELTRSQMETSPKHHFNFVAKFEFELSGSGIQRLTILDSNFQKMDSAARFSLKAVRSTIISQSNVAPIIIRAKRQQLSALTQRQRIQACTITATVVTSSSRESVDTVQ